MKFSHLAHIAFRVSDLGRAMDFYVGKLDLRHVYTMTHGQRQMQTGHVIPEGARPEDPWITFLEFAPKQYIELFSAVPGTERDICNDKHIGYLHFALEVEDIMAAREELIDKGVPIATDVTLGPDGTYQMWVCDPDGNRFEIQQYTDASMELQ